MEYRHEDATSETYVSVTTSRFDLGATIHRTISRIVDSLYPRCDFCHKRVSLAYRLGRMTYCGTCMGAFRYLAAIQRELGGK